MHQPALDLFGEVPITVSELRAWLTQVAGLDPDSPRAAHYLRAYDVPRKIARIKLQMEHDAGPLPADR